MLRDRQRESRDRLFQFELRSPSLPPRGVKRRSRRQRRRKDRNGRSVDFFDSRADALKRRVHLRDDVALLRWPPSAQAAVTESRIEIRPLNDHRDCLASARLLERPHEIAVQSGGDFDAPVWKGALQMRGQKAFHMQRSETTGQRNGERILTMPGALQYF